MESNIDRFNKYAAFFLAKLYSSFPEPCDLDTKEAVTGTPFSASSTTQDLQEATTNPEIRFCASALRWLYDTDYFRGQPNLHNVRVSQAVLTPKGFEALNAVPNSLDQKGSLGNQLLKLGAEGSKTAAQATVSETVGQIIGIAARTLFQP